MLDIAGAFAHMEDEVVFGQPLGIGTRGVSVCGFGFSFVASGIVERRFVRLGFGTLAFTRINFVRFDEGG